MFSCGSRWAETTSERFGITCAVSFTLPVNGLLP